MKSFKGQLIGIGIFFALIFAVGGFTAVGQGLEIVWQSICAFLPIIKPVIKQAFKDYLSSAQFIVGVILFVLTSFGIYFSARFKKYLIMIVSIIIDLISLISLISNLSMCR